MAFELKLTVLHLSSIIVRSSRIDVGGTEHQRHLHHLLLRWLIHSPDVHCQLPESMNMSIIHELNLRAIRLVEDYPHYGLAGSNRAVDLGMNLVNAD